MYMMKTTMTMMMVMFITLSVHLDVQFDAREAARRAGPSATADIVSRRRGDRPECCPVMFVSCGCRSHTLIIIIIIITPEGST